MTATDNGRTVTAEKQKIIDQLNRIQEGFDEYAENLVSAERFQDALNELWDLLVKEETK